MGKNPEVAKVQCCLKSQSMRNWTLLGMKDEEWSNLLKADTKHGMAGLNFAPENPIAEVELPVMWPREQYKEVIRGVEIVHSSTGVSIRSMVLIIRCLQHI